MFFFGADEKACRFVFRFLPLFFQPLVFACWMLFFYPFFLLYIPRISMPSLTVRGQVRALSVLRLCMGNFSMDGTCHRGAVANLVQLPGCPFKKQGALIMTNTGMHTGYPAGDCSVSSTVVPISQLIFFTVSNQAAWDPAGLSRIRDEDCMAITNQV